MKIDLFDFHLPEARIAHYPLAERDAARLLYVPAAMGAGAFEDRVVRDLPQLLAPGDVMVFNDTRVIPARLLGKRGEAAIELLLHKAQADGVTWDVFARPAKRLRVGDRCVFAADFTAEIIAKHADGQVRVRFDCAAEALPARLEAHGHMPLPPYMKRADEAGDKTTYQTVYARHAGSVAAPTAGLHFTETLLQALDARGVERVHITLHVGGGTFLPVKVDDTRDHTMHSEYAEISADAAARINAARARGGKVVAVGTTALRTLESAADAAGTLHPFRGETDIFITPGYRFKLVDRLMTNFHLPRSTLFMLVSAFAGRERMLAAYQHAIEREYRFYSYGDACLLDRVMP